MALLDSQTYEKPDPLTVQQMIGLEGVSPCVTNMGNHPQEDSGDLLLLEPKTKTRLPPMYKVIMHNDDYTPMDFVVEMLKGIFRMQHEDAISVMLQIHHQGCGLCGIFTRDVAETKIELVMHRAHEHEYPLQCTLEQE